MSVRFKGPAGAQVSVTGTGGKTRVVKFDDDGISEPIGDDAIIAGLDDDGVQARRLSDKEQADLDAAEEKRSARTSGGTGATKADSGTGDPPSPPASTTAPGA